MFICEDMRAWFRVLVRQKKRFVFLFNIFFLEVTAVARVWEYALPRLLKNYIPAENRCIDGESFSSVQKYPLARDRTENQCPVQKTEIPLKKPMFWCVEREVDFSVHSQMAVFVIPVPGVSASFPTAQKSSWKKSYRKRNPAQKPEILLRNPIRLERSKGFWISPSIRKWRYS